MTCSPRSLRRAHGTSSPYASHPEAASPAYGEAALRSRRIELEVVEVDELVQGLLIDPAGTEGVDATSAGSGAGSAGGFAPAIATRELFRRFWPYARPYRRRILVALVFLALAPAIQALTIWTYKLAVDRVLVPQDLSALVWVGGLFAALTVLAAAVSFGEDYLVGWVGSRFLFDLRARVFAHLHGLSLDFFDRRSVGDLISRLTGDVAAIETVALSGVADGISYTLRIVFFSAALFLLDPVLALAALAVTPAFWVTTRRFSRTIKAASREKRRRIGAISAVAEESLGNVAVVQAYNRQVAESIRFAEQARAAFVAEVRVTRLRGIFSGVVDVIEMVGVLAVIALGTMALSSGRLTLGGLTAFLAYLTQLYSPVRRLSRLANAVFAATASAERIAELLDQRPSLPEPAAAPRLAGRARGIVTLDEVSFAYPGTGEPVLRDVSIEVSEGQTVALVGASGAGKSTVAKLLLRFYDPTAGCVRLDGRDLRAFRVADLREQVALLLQETLIFDGTVRENIAYGRPAADDEAIRAAARSADADAFIRRMPDGYDSRVGQRGRMLSGGQRQRIAIARAMIRDAPVLVLDEPTSSLDAASADRIIEPLRRLMAGRTTLVISHNLLTVREADQIVVLDHGRVAECGRHDELVALGGIYASLWRLHGSAATTTPATGRMATSP
jgi:ATP-binding cassette subfamily B protein